MKLITDDGNEHLLPDISIGKFEKFIWESGSNDMEFKKYLRDNNMSELTDFNAETIKEATLIIEDNDRTIKFKCVYDSDID